MDKKISGQFLNSCSDKSLISLPLGTTKDLTNLLSITLINLLAPLSPASSPSKAATIFLKGSFLIKLNCSGVPVPYNAIAATPYLTAVIAFIILSHTYNVS